MTETRQTIAENGSLGRSEAARTDEEVAFPGRPVRRGRSERTPCARVLEVVDHGIANQHEIGHLRRDVLREEIGDPGVRLLRAIDPALDPDDQGALLCQAPARRSMQIDAHSAV